VATIRVCGALLCLLVRLYSSATLCLDLVSYECLSEQPMMGTRGDHADPCSQYGPLSELMGVRLLVESRATSPPFTYHNFIGFRPLLEGICLLSARIGNDLLKLTASRSSLLSSKNPKGEKDTFSNSI